MQCIIYKTVYNTVMIYTMYAVEPTGLQLVATFLEKGGVLEGQSPLPTAEANNNSGSGAAAPAPAAVVEERRKRLVSCALFIASFLQWDLALFEKR